MRVLVLVFARLVLLVLNNILGFACKGRVERQREGFAEEVCFGHETSGLFMNKDLEGFCNRRVACLIVMDRRQFCAPRKNRSLSLRNPSCMKSSRQQTLQGAVGHWLAVTAPTNRLSHCDDVTGGVLFRCVEMTLTDWTPDNPYR